MRIFVAFALLTSLALAQTMPAGKPESVAMLQKEEVARMYKRGGLTPRGPYWSLVVVKANGKVFVKGITGAFGTRISPARMNDLKAAINATPWMKITAQKRVGLHHSAADGTDIYLNYRQERTVRVWSNTSFDYAETIPVLEALQEIEAGAKGGTTSSN